MDTYSMLKGHCIHGVVTGKPLELGGALGRNDATGRGVMFTTHNILGKLGISAEAQPSLYRVPGMSEASPQGCSTSLE